MNHDQGSPYILPNRIKLAHLPSPIEKIENFTPIPHIPASLYLKRDDFTGIELSGNKVRKLEYALAEALALGADLLITCGALQSNHARATAAAARKLGLDVHLVLSSSEQPPCEGNYLLSTILGAKFTFISPEVFGETHEDVMNDLKKHYESLGKKAYILPIGASNAIGTFGYQHCFDEILIQEKELGITFDTIVCTVGSGGTYGGLVLGNLLTQSQRQIIGYSISAESSYFEDKVTTIVNEALSLLGLPQDLKPSDLNISDAYKGLGYAQTTAEELLWARNFTQNTGIILDPVYTGKALRGLILDLEAGKYNQGKNVLFIHTGGQFGFLPKYLEGINT